MAYNKTVSSIDADREMILSNDYYLHKAIMQSILSPFRALENQNEEQGLKVVRLSGFLAEKFARAGSIMTKEDEVALKDYLKEEEKKLKEEDPGIDDSTLKTMLAYSKITWVMSLVEETKPSQTKYDM